jgi:hypothetical protein
VWIIRYKFLVKETMKITDVMNVTPYSLVEICRRFEGTNYFDITS